LYSTHAAHQKKCQRSLKPDKFFLSPTSGISTTGIGNNWYRYRQQLISATTDVGNNWYWQQPVSATTGFGIN